MWPWKVKVVTPKCLGPLSRKLLKIQTRLQWRTYRKWHIGRQTATWPMTSRYHKPRGQQNSRYSHVGLLLNVPNWVEIGLVNQRNEPTNEQDNVPTNSRDHGIFWRKYAVLYRNKLQVVNTICLLWELWFPARTIAAVECWIYCQLCAQLPPLPP